MTCYWQETLLLNMTKKRKPNIQLDQKRNSMFGLLLEIHCVQETRWKMEKFSVQSVMSDLSSKWWKTGYIALNAKDGDVSNIIWLNETFHLTATFSKHLFWADTACILKNKSTKECALTVFPFFNVCHDRNITMWLCLCKHAANRLVQHLQDHILFSYFK